MSEALVFSPVHWLKVNFSSRLETLLLRSCSCSLMSQLPEDPTVCVPSDPLVAFLQKLSGTCCWVHIGGPFFCLDTWNELKAAGLSISPHGWVPSGCIPDWVAGTTLCSHLEVSIPPRRRTAVVSRMIIMFPSILIWEGFFCSALLSVSLVVGCGSRVVKFPVLEVLFLCLLVHWYTWVWWMFWLSAVLLALLLILLMFLAGILFSPHFVFQSSSSASSSVVDSVSVRVGGGG